MTARPIDRNRMVPSVYAKKAPGEKLSVPEHVDDWVKKDLDELDRYISQIRDDALALNDGQIALAALRLQQQQVELKLKFEKERLGGEGGASGNGDIPGLRKLVEAVVEAADLTPAFRHEIISAVKALRLT